MLNIQVYNKITCTNCRHRIVLFYVSKIVELLYHVFLRPAKCIRISLSIQISGKPEISCYFQNEAFNEF